MKQRIRRSALALVGLLLLLPAGGFAAPAPKPLSVAPIPYLDPSFIRGADVSTLLAVEQAGGVFSDEQGKAGDALAILKAGGVNWVRLRLWNDPTNPADVVVGGKVLSKKGDPIGGGNCDLPTVLALSQRAKALGLKVLLDFHYSDTWADPGHQLMPKAWQGLDLAGLEDAVYTFTAQTLKTLAAVGASPDMVQLGNETNGGMLWPLGKTFQATPDEVVGGLDGFAALLGAGARAVREADPAIQIALHLADGGDRGLYRFMFDELTKRSVDYDIIGLSFYPFWHGTVAQLADNMNTVSVRYGKPVVVLETAYARTFDDADSQGNVFAVGTDRTGGYKATLQGQATALRDVMAAVADVPGGQGLGVFYWEPAWLPVKGVGWRTGEGNNWDNLTLFDSRGKAAPSLATFRLVETGPETPEPTPAAALPLSLTLSLEEPTWVLPDEVLCAWSDDAYRLAPVTWNPVDRTKVAKPQVLTLKGVVTGTKVPVSASVQVVAWSNVLPDPSFESGVLGEWTIEGTPGTALVERNASNARTGDATLKYWKDRDFTFTARRVISDLKDGTYTLKLWAMGGGGEKSITVTAASMGQTGPEAKLRNTGWLKWAQYTLSNIRVTGGSLDIRLTVDGREGNWGNFDDFELLRVGDLKP